MASLNVEDLFELIVTSPPTPEEHFQNWNRLSKVLQIMGDALRVKRCTADETWSDGSPPTVSATDDDTSETFTLTLPRIADKDPNVRSGNQFFYRIYDGGYYPSSDGYLDDKKKTIKHFAGDVGDIPQGWALCDGTSNGAGNGGSGLNLSSKFLKWSNVAGTFGSSNTGDGGAYSGTTGNQSTGLTINNASLTVSSETTGITTNNASLTISSETTGLTVDDSPALDTTTVTTGITINNASVTVNSATTGIVVNSYDLEYTGEADADITLGGTAVTINSGTANIIVTPPVTGGLLEPAAGATGVNVADSGHTHTSPSHTHSVTYNGHKHTIAAHSHSITDTGHVHTTVAHSHTINDAGHKHLVPIHGHVVTDPGHDHSVDDHNHGISDPGHDHDIDDHNHTTNESAHNHSFSVPDHNHTAGEPPYVTLIPIERIH